MEPGTGCTCTIIGNISDKRGEAASIRYRFRSWEGCLISHELPVMAFSFFLPSPAPWTHVFFLINLHSFHLLIYHIPDSGNITPCSGTQVNAHKSIIDPILGDHYSGYSFGYHTLSPYVFEKITSPLTLIAWECVCGSPQVLSQAECFNSWSSLTKTQAFHEREQRFIHWSCILYLEEFIKT